MKDMITCPFCGDEGAVRRYSEIKAPDGSPGYLPYCTGCGVHPPYSFFTLDDAINWWNNRATQKEEK